jgi:hypothetical protein
MKSPPGWTPDEGHMRRVVIPGACPPYYTRWKTGDRGQRTEDRRWKIEGRKKMVRVSTNIGVGVR